MPAEMFGERFYSYREIPWHQLGLTLDKEMGAQDAFAAIGPYEVALEGILTASGIELPNRAVVRQPTPDDPESRVFGIVGPEYVLMTPQDVCQAWDDAVNAHVETIGALYKGATLFITTKLPDIDVKGDEVHTYMLLVSPMSGYEAMQIRVTPIRVVCHNTLIAARQQTTEVYRVVHDPRAYERMTSWLGGIHARATTRVDLLREFFNLFASTKLDAKMGKTLIEEVYPYPKPPRQDAPQDVIDLRLRYYEDNRTSVERYREAVTRLWGGEGTAMDLYPLHGTAWGLYNAVCEWEDFHGRRDAHLESQAASVLFGSRAQVKERMFAELVEVCQ